MVGCAWTIVFSTSIMSVSVKCGLRRSCVFTGLFPTGLGPLRTFSVASTSDQSDSSSAGPPRVSIANALRPPPSRSLWCSASRCFKPRRILLSWRRVHNEYVLLHRLA
ncbi:unnamed protein product [Dibothriocephalus latus]|uniref:Secreted protein n=1 Tax=Dibothriocephalus latus TaxID=60516 RepID=A0A3P7N4M7_DIBLA|nr:unnamed protein product [Dibothriocephalus latus]